MKHPNFSVCPNEIPSYPFEAARKLADEYKLGPACLMGVRGFYHPKENERGIYDDAIFLISDTIRGYNANVDPKIYHQGYASLSTGIYDYKLGIHGLQKPKEQQYKALVQAGPVTIKRDFDIEDSGYFGINIHRGGYKSTDSLGCQTIWPLQWDGFIGSVESEIKRFGLKQIKYLLIEL